MLTTATIERAKNNNLEAISIVVAETESRVRGLASKFAQRMSPHGGDRYTQYREELAQVGRVAVWEAISRHQGDGVDSFFAFMHHTVEGTLRDYVRAERNGGVDADAMKIFSSMMDAAEGDPHKAEKLAQTLPPKGRRISAERAYAARVAWQGAVSIDAQNDDGSGIADTLAVHDAPQEIRPKVGHGAVIEALSVLRRYAGVRLTAGVRELAAELPALVVALENTVIVPKDETVRRYVLDAMAILRSAVSTAADGELAEELRTADDMRRDERAQRDATVNAILDKMAPAQAAAIRHSFGIGGASEYGNGDSCDLDGLAAALGMTPDNAKKRRSFALKTFAQRWIAQVARTEDEALSWAAAAADARKPKGRK